MSQDERLLRAHDLALSAFLAETIYNFGELVRFSQLTFGGGPRTALIAAAFLVWWTLYCVADAPHPRLAGWYSA